MDGQSAEGDKLVRFSMKAGRCSLSPGSGGYGPASGRARPARTAYFSFLTTEANDVVRPIHAKAMPVLLTTPGEWDTWLEGSHDDAIALQQPLPNEKLRIVASGEKMDASE